MNRSEEQFDPRDLRLRVLASIEAVPADPALEGVARALHRLCRAAATDLDLMGAAVHLMSVSEHQGVVAVSGVEARPAADLPFAIGEGPALDAFQARRPALVGDLEASTARRWPGYTSAAMQLGVRAVFAFPLHVGAVCFAVLDLYRTTSGPLGGEQAALAMTYADIATGLLLEPGNGTLDGRIDPGMERALDYRAEVAQAQGMVMVDLGVGLAEALVLLRAHAFTQDLPLVDLARRVIRGYRVPGPHDLGTDLE